MSSFKSWYPWAADLSLQEMKTECQVEEAAKPVRKKSMSRPWKTNMAVPTVLADDQNNEQEENKIAQAKDDFQCTRSTNGTVNG